jgi:flagella basal body P-ring formation protein FlgA
MSAIVLLLVTADPSLQHALEAANAVPGSQLEVLEWKAPPCHGHLEVAATVDASGRVPVRVRGAGCDAWGWAVVRLTVMSAVATRSLRFGDRLQGAWALERREVHRGNEALTEIAADATANRLIKQGQPIGQDAVRVGPPPGSPITIRVSAGGIAVEQTGTTIPCAGPHVCATLPRGKRVMGTLRDGVLVVAADGAHR